jgi:hypothetical protein
MSVSLMKFNLSIINSLERSHFQVFCFIETHALYELQLELGTNFIPNSSIRSRNLLFINILL